MNGYPIWLERLALPELSPEVAALDVASRSLFDPAAIADFILQQREAIRRQGLKGLTAASRYSDVMDVALRRMLTLARQEQGASAAEDGTCGVAILSTGGYGRRELAPFSDVDVTFVPVREDDPAVDELVRALFRTLMEAVVRKAGLKVGYAYRLVSDCGSLELQTQTSLIDARFIAGDYGLFADFKEELRRQIHPARFIFDKAWERAVARENAGGTIYRLEPDLKNGPGGLREIHTAIWLAQVRFGVWSSAVWEEMIDRDVVSFRQVERLYEALEFMHTLRNLLHWRAGKQNDTLLTAQQTEVAEEMGFQESECLTASQGLMGAFFSHADHINSIAQRVMSWVLESRLELGDGLACLRHRIECMVPDLFISRPCNLVRAFWWSQSLGIAFAPELEGTVRNAIEQKKALPPDRPCYALLRQIMENPERVASTLHAMANLQVLGWLLPEFRPLMNLAPRNSIHEFTVGYHSLEVVRRLEDMGAGAAESVFQEVFSHLDYPPALLLAGLLHDAGKAVTKAPHSETGAEMVPAVGMRLDLPPHQVRKIQTLVLNHLVMAEVAQFRDVTRDESIKELLEVVPDQESLDQLFLLTYADGASVGNHVWTPVQTRFLEELYHRASHMLTQPETETGQFDLRRYQRRVTQALRAHNLAPDEVARHVELMPASYLLNTPSETMALHIEMLAKVQESGKPIVEFRDDRAGHFTELIICVLEDPHPGLLSKIAGCLWASDMSVYSAQVFTRDGDPRIAIDTLWIAFHGHTLDPYHKRRLEMDLVKVLSNDTPVGELLASHGKERDLNAPLREPDVAGRRTHEHIICEVHAGDQRGLLYRITRTISELGWDIHSARINGGKSRARDVFYVDERTGLSGEEAASKLRDRLMAQASVS